MTDSGPVQALPGKMFARVHLASGRNIRMPQHPLRRDSPAFHDILTECSERMQLHFGKRWQTAIMAQIGDFYAD